MGFTKAVIPQKNAARLADASGGIAVVGVNSLSEAIQIVRQPERM
jgi:predicted ATP-dependent serine protease